MRVPVLLLFLSFAVTATTGPAHAASVPDAYAGALRSFDPTLGTVMSRRLADRVIWEADRARLDARLIVALVAVESSWHARARSSAGAIGLGQLMPETAAGLRVDPADPEANLDGTVRYLRGMIDRYARLPPQDRYERAIAAYNAGPGAVDRYGAIPPYAETQAYVRRVIGLWRRLCGL